MARTNLTDTEREALEGLLQLNNEDHREADTPSLSLAPT